jgi:phosphoglycerate dehydrogenase-like enzyme
MRRIALSYDFYPDTLLELEKIAANRCELIFLGPPGGAEDAPVGCEAFIGHIEPQRLANSPDVKWIQTAYAGVERILQLARERGITLTNASGSFGGCISEFLITYTLMLQKNMLRYTELFAQRDWRYLGNTSKTISGSRVTVVGLGDLGGNFARKMNALGAIVTGVKRTPGVKTDYLDALYTVDELDRAIADADVVALCLPNTDETAGLFTRERVFALKPGAILLNAGRGTAIDQDALIDALTQKRIFAGLDVATPEPLPPDSPLWDMDNLVMTPHVSGFASFPYVREIFGKLVLRNLAAYLDGRELENTVDLTLGY